MERLLRSSTEPFTLTTPAATAVGGPALFAKPTTLPWFHRGMTITRAISGAVFCAIVVPVSACSASVSAGASLSEEKIEKQLAQLLEKQTGVRPDDVDCPDDLPGKKDAVLKCSVTATGETHAVKLTVTEVDGTDIKYRYKVVESTGTSLPTNPVVDKATLEKKVADILEQEVGQRPDKIECPGDLEGTVGETMRCTLTAGTDQLGLTVTVHAVDGSNVDFGVKVDG